MTTLTRIQRNTAGTLRHTFTLDEDPEDSSTTVTYAVVDATGAAVASGNAVLDAVASGTYSFVLPAQTALAALTVTWVGTIGGSATTQTTGAEIVGGFFFSLAEGRGSDTALADTAKYTLDDLATARLEVEWECEHICDLAFLPRYDRVVLDGSGTGELLLKHSDRDRSVAEVRTAFTAGELADLAVSADGTLVRTGGDYFTEGRSNVIVEFEYGLDRPPPDLIRQALVRFRTALNTHRSGIPDRASSYVAGEGGTFRLDMPGPFKTGVPTVDAAYARYSRRSTGTGATGRSVPASRTLTYTPQAGSMFHGWRRR
jgi:hypothetical protein